eukprot:scaffold50492_cov84-Phaeocystis_antarctica.AAC.7
MPRAAARRSPPATKILATTRPARCAHAPHPRSVREGRSGPWTCVAQRAAAPPCCSARATRTLPARLDALGPGRAARARRGAAECDGRARRGPGQAAELGPLLGLRAAACLTGGALSCGRGHCPDPPPAASVAASPLPLPRPRPRPARAWPGLTWLGLSCLVLAWPAQPWQLWIPTRCRAARGPRGVVQGEHRGGVRSRRLQRLRSTRRRSSLTAMRALRVHVPGVVDSTLLVWYVLGTPMVSFHAAGTGVLGYPERTDKPDGNGLVNHADRLWDTLGLGKGPRKVPLTGKKEYETIAYPPGAPAARQLMLTIPQLLQAVNGNNNNSSSTRALIVHELAEQLTLEDAITKGTWLQVFKDARAALPTLTARRAVPSNPNT